MKNYEYEQNKNYESTKQMFEECRKDVGVSKGVKRAIPVLMMRFAFRIFRKMECVLRRSLKTDFAEKLSGAGTEKTSICCTAVFVLPIIQSGFRWTRKAKVRHYI